MKRTRSFIFLISIGLAFNLFATEQEPDSVNYRGQVGILGGGWSYPSPLQHYFKSNPDLSNPLEWCGRTNNYRGHVAKWAIKGSNLYLDKIYDCNEQKINMSTIFGDTVSNEPLIASWFTGYIEVYTNMAEREVVFVDDDGKKFYDYPRYQTTILIEIEKGKIVNEYEYDSERFNELDHKHYIFEEIPDEQKVIFDKYRTWIESTMHPKTVKFWHKQRKKYLKMKEKESNKR